MLHSSQSAPVVDGKVMEFVIFAIESAAQKLGIPAPTLYNRLEKLNLIRQYLISGYDMLHTQSREYIADTLVEVLENWEAHYKEKGEWPSGVDLNGNTIYFKFHLTADGSFLTYANGNGDFKNSGDWGTNYIYDSAAKKWYYSSKGTNLGGISNSIDKGGKTEAQIIDKINCVYDRCISME